LNGLKLQIVSFDTFSNMCQIKQFYLKKKMRNLEISKYFERYFLTLIIFDPRRKINNKYVNSISSFCFL